MTWHGWSGQKPRNLRELFDFYYECVKPLYALVQTEGSLPQEILFEINAALDHVSRIWIYEEDEAEAVEKAFSHFKRSCLDVFKILTQEAYRQYDELRTIDTGLIDNGEFDRELHRLWLEIKSAATEARQIEGQPDTGNAVPAFDKWQDAAVSCLRLEEEFYHHGGIEWAKRRGKQNAWASRFEGAAGSTALLSGIYYFSSPDRFTLSLVVLAVVLEVIAVGLSPARRAAAIGWMHRVRERVSPRRG